MSKSIDKEIYDDYIGIRKKYNMRLLDKNYESNYFEIDNNVKGILKKNMTVLELGSGHGNFAYYCNKVGVKNYTGVDISQQQIDICKKRFKKYSFNKNDILKFLKENKIKFDFIYMSHVFEHFSKEDGLKILRLIKTTLSPNGVFVNVMPNGGAYFNAYTAHCTDLTHKQIYNNKSFSNLIELAGFRNYSHKNSHIGRNYFSSLVHKFFMFLFQLFIRILGYSSQKIYTTSIVSIINSR